MLLWKGLRILTFGFDEDQVLFRGENWPKEATEEKQEEDEGEAVPEFH